MERLIVEIVTLVIPRGFCFAADSEGLLHFLHFRNFRVPRIPKIGERYSVLLRPSPKTNGKIEAYDAELIVKKVAL